MDFACELQKSDHLGPPAGNLSKIIVIVTRRDRLRNTQPCQPLLNGLGALKNLVTGFTSAIMVVAVVYAVFAIRAVIGTGRQSRT